MTAQPVTAVEFYWRPGCPFCIALRRRLRRRGIPTRPVNIWEHPEAAQRVRAVTGGDETVPTVFVGNRSLVNPSLGEVEALLGELAPELLELPANRGWFRRRGDRP